MLSNEFLLKGVAAPLAAGFAATLLAHSMFRGRRAIAALGLAIAQATGVGLVLSGAGTWLPSRNLEWVPWTIVGAAAIGPMLVAGGLAAIERWILALLTSLAAATLIVPDWPDLWPSRTVSIASVTVALAILARGIEGISRRLPPRLLAIAMASSALVAAGLIAASLSLTLGQSVLTTAAALIGVVAALLIRPDAAALGGLALPYAIGLGGWCYVSAIELPPPAPPLLGLLFIPAAPLTLWAISVGPLARKRPGARWLIGAALVITALAAAGAWTWKASESEGDDEYSFTLLETTRP